MEFVCNDTEGDWYFFLEEKKYKRILNGNVGAKISGKYLADPKYLLERRLTLYPNARIEDIKPSDATVKLWEHWKNVTGKE